VCTRFIRSCSSSAASGLSWSSAASRRPYNGASSARTRSPSAATWTRTASSSNCASTNFTRCRSLRPSSRATPDRADSHASVVIAATTAVPPVAARAPSISASTASYPPSELHSVVASPATRVAARRPLGKPLAVRNRHEKVTPRGDLSHSVMRFQLAQFTRWRIGGSSVSLHCRVPAASVAIPHCRTAARRPRLSLQRPSAPCDG
jgi:hypothetical protein